MPCLVIGLYLKGGDVYKGWDGWRKGIASVAFVILNHFQIFESFRKVNMKQPSRMEDYYELWKFTTEIGSIFKPDCVGFQFDTFLVVQTIAPAVYLLMGALTW